MPLCLFLSSTTFLYIPRNQEVQRLPIYPPNQEVWRLPPNVPQLRSEGTILCSRLSWGLFEKNWNSFLVTLAEKKKEKSLQSISKPPQIIWQICLNGRKSLRNPDTAWPFCVSFQIWLRSLHCFGHIFATRVFFSESGHVRDLKHIVRDKAVGSQLFTICSALSLGNRKTTSPFP